MERWYESVDTRRPLTTVAEGEVVRVRLRITVPEDRGMVVLDDPLPAGLEAVDLSLRTVSPFSADLLTPRSEDEVDDHGAPGWYFGSRGRGDVVAVRPHRDPRRPRGLTPRGSGGELQRHLPGTRHHRRALRLGPGARRGDVQPRRACRSGGGLFTVRPAGR